MLKNDIPELVLFYDLEWVPDAAGAKRLYGLPNDATELEAMDTLWRNTSQYDKEKCPRPFVKYMFSRVVSIAFLSRKVVYDSNRSKTLEFKLNSFPELPFECDVVDEAYIIERFLYVVGKRRPQLVGFNSQDSDLQVLIQRGLINEVSSPAFCQRPDKPWNGDDYFDARNSEGHIDLVKRFSSGAMMPRLDELAKLCGYPGKIDVHGDQVVDLWLERNVTKIVEYNQIDALNTYLIWFRLVHFCGKLTGEEYMNEQQQFRQFLETESQKPNKEYISQFLAKWDE